MILCLSKHFFHRRSGIGAFFHRHSFFQNEDVLVNLEGLNYQTFLDYILCGPTTFKVEPRRLFLLVEYFEKI